MFSTDILATITTIPATWWTVTFIVLCAFVSTRTTTVIAERSSRSPDSSFSSETGTLRIVQRIAMVGVLVGAVAFVIAL